MTAELNKITIAELNNALPLRKINDMIERFDMSADAKAVLRDLSRISVTIGGTLIHIGRKILTLAAEICKRFPNTVFGVVVTVAVSILLAALGPIAAMLAPVVTPLMLVFAVTKGMMADYAQANWAASLRDVERKLAQAVSHGAL